MFLALTRALLARRPVLMLRLAVLLFVGLALVSGCRPDSGVAEPATVEAGLALGGGPLLLDVRTPEEFASGFVPGATNIPVDELEGRLVEIEAYAERGVVTYCESGRRADRALGVLRAAGFQHLSVLRGSMQQWRAEKRPIARPTSRVDLRRPYLE